MNLNMTRNERRNKRAKINRYVYGLNKSRDTSRKLLAMTTYTGYLPYKAIVRHLSGR